MDPTGKKFVVWSNAVPFKDPSEYARRIRGFGSIKGSVNVFVNRMYPLSVAADAFELSEAMSVSAACAREYGWGGVQGGESLFGIGSAIPFKYVLERDGDSIKAGIVRRIEVEGEEVGRETVFRFGYQVPGYPKSAKCGPSGGFRAVQFLRGFFGADSLTLCNFGRNDGWRERCGGIHDLDFEIEWYRRNGICMVEV